MRSFTASKCSCYLLKMSFWRFYLTSRSTHREYLSRGDLLEIFQTADWQKQKIILAILLDTPFNPEKNLSRGNMSKIILNNWLAKANGLSPIINTCTQIRIQFCSIRFIFELYEVERIVRNNKTSHFCFFKHYEHIFVFDILTLRHTKFSL